MFHVKPRANVLLVDDDPLELMMLSKQHPDIRFDWLPNIYFVNELLFARKKGFYSCVLVDLNGTQVGTLDASDIKSVSHENVFAISGAEPVHLDAPFFLKGSKELKDHLESLSE